MINKRNKKLDSEVLPFLTRQGNSRDIFSYPVVAHDYVVYIGELDYPEEHLEKIQLLRMASPDDTIRLIINSPGGLVSLAMSYISAINESAARIITHAEGTVASAGTLLWLAGEDKTVSTMTEFMFHNYQGGTYGDGANMYSQIAFEKQYFDRLIDTTYAGVLTTNEIATIKGGGQVWMDEEEIVKRTKATVLTKEYIRQARGITEDPAQSREGKDLGLGFKVTMKDGSEVCLDIDSFSKSQLSVFNVKELYGIAQQVAGCVGVDLKKDLDVSSKSGRAELEDALEKLFKVANDTLLRED